jgi:uncharacterized damage-inducible protein DinB
MSYYGGSEMARSFRTVRSNTLLIAEEIPGESYDYRPTPDSRSIAETLTHVAVLHRMQSHIQQNNIDDLKNVNFGELSQQAAAEERTPRTKAEIIELLRSEGETFASYLESLPESFLSEPVAMPPGATPPTKSRFEMLMSVKEHEMHHRGQLMLAQRLLGQTPHLTRERQKRAEQAAQAAAQAGR